MPRPPDEDLSGSDETMMRGTPLAVIGNGSEATADPERNSRPVR